MTTRMVKLLLGVSVIAFLVLSAVAANNFAFGSPSQAAETGATKDGDQLSRPAKSGSLTADDIIAKLLEHNQLRNAQLQRYSAVRTYEVRNLEGKLSAQEVVQVEYRAPDKKTFQKTSEQGSGIVRHLVFDRLMQSENETASGQEHHNSALTPANYTFLLLGEEDLGPYHCYVVETAPKRSDKYLFEGTVWIDAGDFAVVKIAGHPARRPSFWIKRADFVRKYQRIDGFWVPSRDETLVEVRIHGKKVFTIDHDRYSINNDAGSGGR